MKLNSCRMRFQLVVRRGTKCQHRCTAHSVHMVVSPADAAAVGWLGVCAMREVIGKCREHLHLVAGGPFP